MTTLVILGIKERCWVLSQVPNFDNLLAVYHSVSFNATWNSRVTQNNNFMMTSSLQPHDFNV